MTELDYILNACCEVVGVSQSTIKNKYRGKYHVIARHLFLYFASLKGYQDKEIGRMIKRNRLTAYYGAGKIKAYIQINDAFVMNYIRKLENLLSEENFKLQRMQNEITFLKIEDLMILRSNITDLIQKKGHETT